MRNFYNYVFGSRTCGSRTRRWTFGTSLELEETSVGTFRHHIAYASISLIKYMENIRKYDPYNHLTVQHLCETNPMYVIFFPVWVNAYREFIRIKFTHPSTRGILPYTQHSTALTINKVELLYTMLCHSEHQSKQSDLEYGHSIIRP